MPRWEPDARERLVVAALHLFNEQGYDETTVAQIVDRAGLTRPARRRSRDCSPTASRPRPTTPAPSTPWPPASEVPPER
jgi:hypothetical protein